MSKRSIEEWREPEIANLTSELLLYIMQNVQNCLAHVLPKKVLICKTLFSTSLGGNVNPNVQIIYYISKIKSERCYFTIVIHCGLPLVKKKVDYISNPL